MSHFPLHISEILQKQEQKIPFTFLKESTDRWGDKIFPVKIT